MVLVIQHVLLVVANPQNKQDEFQNKKRVLQECNKKMHTFNGCCSACKYTDCTKSNRIISV